MGIVPASFARKNILALRSISPAKGFYSAFRYWKRVSSHFLRTAFVPWSSLLNRCPVGGRNSLNRIGELTESNTLSPAGSISPMILCSVYVLIALALGEYGAIDRSADPKGKLQLAIF
jgi:hypothetical protein